MNRYAHADSPLQVNEGPARTIFDQAADFGIYCAQSMDVSDVEPECRAAMRWHYYDSAFDFFLDRQMQNTFEGWPSAPCGPALN